MTASSALRGGRDGGEHPLVARECRPDIDAPAGERDHGLDVLEALAAFLAVEVLVRSVADDAGLRGQVEESEQSAAIALVQVSAGAPSGGAVDRDQAGRRREVAAGPVLRSHCGQGTISHIRLSRAGQKLMEKP